MLSNGLGHKQGKFEKQIKLVQPHHFILNGLGYRNFWISKEAFHWNGGNYTRKPPRPVTFFMRKRYGSINVQLFLNVALSRLAHQDDSRISHKRFGKCREWPIPIIPMCPCVYCSACLWLQGAIVRGTTHEEEQTERHLMTWLFCFKKVQQPRGSCMSIHAYNMFNDLKTCINNDQNLGPIRIHSCPDPSPSVARRTSYPSPYCGGKSARMFIPNGRRLRTFQGDASFSNHKWNHPSYTVAKAIHHLLMYKSPLPVLVIQLNLAEISPN